MNSQQLKIVKFTTSIGDAHSVKKSTRNHPIEGRQLFIIVRIMISIITIGLIGYILDRFMQSLQQRPS